MPRGIYTRTDKMIHNMSKAQRGLKKSKIHKKHLSESQLGRRLPPRSKEWCKHLKDNHWTKRHDADKICKRIGKANSGANHGAWIKNPHGNFYAMHYRIYKKFGRPSFCESCNCSGKNAQLEWSNKDHKYDSLKRNRWQMLCRGCHMIYDRKHNGRRKNQYE